MVADRRAALALIGSALAAPAFAQGAGMSRVKAYAFSFKGLRGEDIRLADFSGRPILIVNTASLCGYTPQYAGLQTLWRRYRDKGLMIVGVPSDDFGGQEPGGEAEIGHTLHRYAVGFPITAKVPVRGAAAHPFYRWAAIERPLDTPRWNFHKYLVGRDGHLVAVFAAAVEPTHARVVAAVERALAPG